MLKSLIKAILPARLLSSWKRRAIWAYRSLAAPRSEILHFTCNICGKAASFPRKLMMRESMSCVHCGSTVRFRSIVDTLSRELFDQSLAIHDFPVRKDLKGIGMSDFEGYASRLPAKLDYTNTFYHQEPFLDISSPALVQSDLYDFIIATEVFEHVSQPISRAFQNAFQLLKPGGVLIFSVPVVPGKTLEHFPELHTFTVAKEGSHWVLHNETADGRHQQFKDITFHGGPGTTVEMRVFGDESLDHDFRGAAFTQVKPYEAEVPQFGIVWNPYIPEDAPYRPFIYGLDAPPWTARKPLR